MPNMMPEADAPMGEQFAEQVVQGQTGWFANSPWWLISLGIHIVALLATTLITMEKLQAIDDGGIEALLTPQQAKLIEVRPIEPPFERTEVPEDTPYASAEDPDDVFFPEARVSDHCESADNEDWHEMKGDSKDFRSYIPGEAGGIGRQRSSVAGTTDAIGTGPGGGSGGRYGGRRGGRENLVKRGGGGKQTEDALTEALKWLCRHQSPDGSWKAREFEARCASGSKCMGSGKEDYDVGLTSLSLLAFLGAGYTHMSHDKLPDNCIAGKTWDLGQVVKSAMQWLISTQNADGSFGPQGISQPMYNNAIAALALSEAYGMTLHTKIKDPAQKAIDYIISAQNPGKGWRYTKQAGDNDTSVTGWCIMALKNADMSELTFDHTAYAGALAWLKEATDDGGYYIVGYNHAGTGKVVIPGKNEKFEHHQSMSAVTVMSRIFMQKDKKEPALGVMKQIADDPPVWKENMIDFYYWYYASLAMFQYDGPEGPMWQKWNKAMKEALVPHQKTKADGCQAGSWPTETDGGQWLERWGGEGGRVYATAVNALTLEVYYRYQSVWVKQSEQKAK